MSEKRTIRGIDVVVKNPEEVQADIEAGPEEAIYVCVPVDGIPSIFADDQFGECYECGVAIRFRPHAPVDMRKVCLHCGLNNYGGGLTVAATAASIEDYDLFQKKKVN